MLPHVRTIPTYLVELSFSIKDVFEDVLQQGEEAHELTHRKRSFNPTQKENSPFLRYLIVTYM